MSRPLGRGGQGFSNDSNKAVLLYLIWVGGVVKVEI